MVIAVEQLEVDNPPSEKETCASRRRGRVTRCHLPAGHSGFHEARIWTRRPPGVLVSYRFSWLDD